MQLDPAEQAARPARRVSRGLYLPTVVITPAQRRPVLARGHLLDFSYVVFYALLVIPQIVRPQPRRS